MASGYPGSLDALATNKSDGTATGAGDHAGHHDDLADAVNKIEAELGTDPSGAWATVKARLDAWSLVARAHATADQTVLDSTTVALALDVEDVDTDGVHDPVTNNSRFTCNTAGWYAFVGQAEFTANGAGTRELFLRKNGSGATPVLGGVKHVPAGSGTTRLNVVAVVQLAVTDYVELCVWQNSTATLNSLAAAGAYTPATLSMLRVG